MKSIVPFLSAFAICTVILLFLVPFLKKKKAGQEILQYVVEHSSKSGTPTMGGIAFIVATSLTVLAFCKINRTLLVTVAVFVGYGVVGFLDDFTKIRYRQNLGLKPYQKIIFQSAIAVIVAIYVWNDLAIGSQINIPFVGKTVDVGWWIMPLVIFVFLATTNGVNLTDGLDGLATSTEICYFVGVALLLFKQSDELYLTGDVALNNCRDGETICFAVVGALCAFLLFNCFPAKCFMGDVGSLSLGALSACVAIFTRNSLFIPLFGIAFVVSCCSVIMQVVYFKLTKGKRIFLMSPYHHHLQKKGLSEVRICVIYCVVTVVVICLTLLVGGYYV